MLKAFAVCSMCISTATEASRFRSLPEPYGHTAQVSPHAPNRDREWYTEYRWKDGTQYKPQDGSITTKPKHAPIPKQIHEEKKEQWGKPLNKEPQKASTSDSNATKVEVTGAAGAPLADKDKGKGGSNSSNPTIVKSSSPTTNSTKVGNGTSAEIVKSSQGLTGTPEAVKKEPTYAVPKPCGHTSQVHPFHSNTDREWYTEYRWKPGTEYKAQDGVITEKPKPAMRGISRTPDGEPCVPIKA